MNKAGDIKFGTDNGGDNSAAKKRMLFMCVVMVMLLIAFYALNRMMEVNPKKTREKTSRSALAKLENYRHSLAPAVKPAPPFQEEDGAFKAVVDSSAGNVVELQGESDALLYLLHKVYATGHEKMLKETVDVDYDKILLHPEQYRGKTIRHSGELLGLWEQTLPLNNRSQLEKIYCGFISQPEGRNPMYFFSTGYPLNIYEKDEITVTGAFFKIHGKDMKGYNKVRHIETLGMEIAPLILVAALEVSPPGPFTEDETLLHRVVNDSDLRVTRTVNPKAYEYMLHKLATEDREEFWNKPVADIGILDLINQPQQHRGKLIEIRGVFMEAVRVTLKDRNSANIRNVYQGFVAVAVDRPMYRFWSIDPPLFDKSDEVVLRGYFVQNRTYDDKKNNRRSVPVVFTHNLKSYKPIITQTEHSAPWILGLIIFLVLLLILYLTYRDLRQSSRSTAETYSRFRPSIDKIKQAGSKLREIHDQNQDKKTPEKE